MKPAEMLEGLELDGGWRVEERLVRPRGATGGHFSIPYVVRRSVHGGGVEEAFLKALDFSKAPELAVNAGLPLPDVFRNLLDAFIHERDLVNACTDARMRNVLSGKGAGEIELDDSSIDPLLRRVSYLILERADGDVRTHLASDEGKALDWSWRFRVLHGVANGLRQLHTAGIAHQDLKPSNVMTVDGIAKVGDLGRSAIGDGGPFADLPIAGDHTYAPPELLYREVNPDAQLRRQQCDAFHLGSLATFLIAEVSLTPSIIARLDPTFHWRGWPRDYRNALPYVLPAYDEVLDEVMASVPSDVAGDVEAIVRELSDPHPELRGRPTQMGSRRIDFQRYVSAFDRLGKTVEIAVRAARR